MTLSADYADYTDWEDKAVGSKQQEEVARSLLFPFYGFIFESVKSA